jgi:hypothetical protein
MLNVMRNPLSKLSCSHVFHVAAVVVIALAIAACGSASHDTPARQTTTSHTATFAPSGPALKKPPARSDAEIRSIVTEYANALKSGNGEIICSLLSASAKAGLAMESKSLLGRTSSSCATIAQAFTKSKALQFSVHNGALTAQQVQAAKITADGYYANLKTAYTITNGSGAQEANAQITVVYGLTYAENRWFINSASPSVLFKAPKK